MRSDFLISAVVPCKNEEKTIPYSYQELVRYLEQYNYELIFVNDGSTDKTLPRLKEIASANSRVKVISFTRNFGQQAAFFAGLNCAGGDCIILLDADLQTPAALIPEMIGHWANGSDGVFSTYRPGPEARFFKRVTAQLFYTVYNLLSGNSIPHRMSNLLLIDAQFKSSSKKYLLLKASLFNAAANKTMIDFEMPARKFGETKFGYGAMLKLGLLNVIVALQAPVLARYIIDAQLHYEIEKTL